MSIARRSLTRGPWVVEYHMPDGAAFHPTAGRQLPAVVRISVRAGFLNGRRRPCIAAHVACQADAHAIAAVPDLVAALERVERLIESVAFVSQPGDTDEPLRELRQAIASANGIA